MADILTELFDQLRPDEQSVIKAAKEEAETLIAKRELGVKMRYQPRGLMIATGSCNLEIRHSQMLPVPSFAYREVLWDMTDKLLPASIQELVEQLNKVREGILKRYGTWGGNRAVSELQDRWAKDVLSFHAKWLDLVNGAEQLLRRIVEEAVNRFPTGIQTADFFRQRRSDF